jgi:outer membrane protein OmpA-like peptidoglycan-associated protein
MRRFLIFFLVWAFCQPPAAVCQRTDSLVVYFGFDRWDVSPAADSALHRWLLEQIGHGTIGNVSLSGYCDAVGSDGYNDLLSLRRAMAVMQWLFHRLPDSGIQEVRGFGKRQPLNGNMTKEERSKNRRVVVLVTLAAQPVVSQPVAAEPVPAQPSAGKPPASPQPIYAALKDSATRVGTSIVLKNVNFYGGRHFPVESSNGSLNELLRAMRDNSHLTICIEGYVCCIPDSLDGPDIDTRKPDLSVARARFVYDYLWQHGIDSTRMSYTGFGAAHKIYPEERDATEKALNRRVEVRIMAR